MKILLLLALSSVLLTSTVIADDTLLRKNMTIDPSLTLTWTAPTTWDNGEPLSLGDIAEYRLYAGIDLNSLALFQVFDNVGGMAFSYETPVVEGVMHYTMTSYSVDNMESELSILRGVFGFIPKSPSILTLEVQ